MWLAREGFVLEQVERAAVLTLTDPALPERLSRLLAKAAAAASGYRTVTFQGRTPADLLEVIAQLRTAMSTAPPDAGLDFEQEVWDPDRLRQTDERVAMRGFDRLMTIAVHEDTGEAVAFTEVLWQATRRRGVHQEDTLVLAEHRGHSLGLLVKATNLLALMDANPDGQRVHTWNADENAHMVAINDAFGFAPGLPVGAWQRRTDQPPAT